MTRNSRKRAAASGMAHACFLTTPKFKPGDLPPDGYLAWLEWADVQRKAGIRQSYCGGCSKWRTPQEKCCGLRRLSLREFNATRKMDRITEDRTPLITFITESNRVDSGAADSPSANANTRAIESTAGNQSCEAPPVSREAVAEAIRTELHDERYMDAIETWCTIAADVAISMLGGKAAGVVVAEGAIAVNLDWPGEDKKCIGGGFQFSSLTEKVNARIQRAEPGKRVRVIVEGVELKKNPKFSTGGADRRVRRDPNFCASNSRTGLADRRVAALAQLRVAIDDGVIDAPYEAVLALRQQTTIDVTELVEAAVEARVEALRETLPYIQMHGVDETSNCECGNDIWNSPIDGCAAEAKQKAWIAEVRAYDLARAKLREGMGGKA